MKTTIEIPEPLYSRATLRAVEVGKSLKELMLTALSHELENAPPPEQLIALKEQELLYHINPQGFTVLNRKPDDSTVITDTLINQMREELGI